MVLQPLRNALKEFRRSQDKWAIALTLDSLGRIARSINDEKEASSAFREALQVAYDSRETELVLDILVGLASFFSQKGEKPRAIEFLALSLQHPNIQEQTENEAERLIFELDQDVAPQILADAWERGKNLHLDDLVLQLLETLDQP
jgi:hypothetical protein